VSADSSFNTAISFVTNTDWQGYAGESTMSHLTQMAGLGVQNFLSAATGIAVALALVRGFARHDMKGIGNFWADIVRSSLYVLLPLSVILALVLVSQGVIQNLDAFKDATLVEALHFDKPQTDANGDALKDANGNAVTEPAVNENADLADGPGGLSGGHQGTGNQRRRLLQRQLCPPVRKSHRADQCARDRGHPAHSLRLDLHLRDAWSATRARAGRWWPPCWSCSAPCRSRRSSANNRATRSSPNTASTTRRPPLQAGGNMEGKETRFGIAASALFAAATTATSCGAVNAAHDSLMPMGGFVPLFLMQLGELAPGGVGTGIYTILDLRHTRRVHRRAHDRPDARISRQEDYRQGEMKLASIFILTTPILVSLAPRWA
jgi:K+-transporting ATPase ATPase A chain